MKRIAFVGFILALLLVYAQTSNAQFKGGGGFGTPGFTSPTVTVSSPIAVTSSGENTAFNTPNATLPSANNGDLVLVLVSGYAFVIATPTSTHLTFTQLYASVYPSYGAIYGATAGSSLTNEAITYPAGASAIIVLALSNAKNSSPLDTGATGSGVVAASSGSGQSLTTGSAAGDFVVALTGNSIASADSGWTALANNSSSVFFFGEYKTNVGASAALSPTFGGGGGSPSMTLAILHQ